MQTHVQQRFIMTCSHMYNKGSQWHAGICTTKVHEMNNVFNPHMSKNVSANGNFDPMLTSVGNFDFHKPYNKCQSILTQPISQFHRASVVIGLKSYWLLGEWSRFSIEFRVGCLPTDTYYFRILLQRAKYSTIAAVARLQNTALEVPLYASLAVTHIIIGGIGLKKI